MNCREAQLFLLTHDADDALPPALHAHVESCAACARVAMRLELLAGAVRAMPAAAGSAEARAVFERRLRGEAEPAERRLRIWAGVPNLARLAIAAALLLAGGVGTWAYLHQPPATSVASANVGASGEEFNQLVAWNLDLADKASPDERKHAYDTGATAMKQKAGEVGPDREDQKLASALMENGSYLLESNDPLEQADRFNEVASRLVERMDFAARQGRVKAVNRLGQVYCDVVERGVSARLDRLARQGPQALAGDRANRLTKLLQLNAQQQQRLRELLATAPVASREQIRKALDVSAKPHAKHQPARTAPPSGVDPSKGPVF